MLRINERLSIPSEEIRVEFARSGGPGGQNVNKVNSKAMLRWNPVQSACLPPAVRERLLKRVGHRLTGEGDLLITSQATRDQSRNVSDCLAKLRALVLSVATPPKVRRPTRPTHASKVRRAESKARRAETKRGRRAPESE
jgi:ribosome-associated protein